MKERMSRNHKTRHNFHVNSLLDTVTQRNTVEEEKNGAPNNYMTLLFLGFYNKLMVEEQFVEVEIVVSKIAQMKRKDSFKSKQDRVSMWLKYFTKDKVNDIQTYQIKTSIDKNAFFSFQSLPINSLVLPLSK